MKSWETKFDIVAEQLELAARVLNDALSQIRGLDGVAPPSQALMDGNIAAAMRAVTVAQQSVDLFQERNNEDEQKAV